MTNRQMWRRNEQAKTFPRGYAIRHVCMFGVPQTVREFLRCHVLRPLLRLLRGGVTPRRLAWSLALGMMVGINPTVGLTTVLLILIAWVFRLSQTASQLGMHAMAPLHLLLFLPFMQAGVPVSYAQAAVYAAAVASPEPSSTVDGSHPLAMAVACAGGMGHHRSGTDATVGDLSAASTCDADATSPHVTARS